MSRQTMEASCMELALEGERLCKLGNCREAVRYLEAAVRVGTDDLQTLSAIYSQLGNAYFYLQDYLKALTYHKHDLTLARSIEDRLGEAKASGNIGNTLKVLGKYDEAILCCQKHLEISRELKDTVGEARALYNLGNVYHAKGKSAGKAGHQEPGDFPETVTSCLKQAIVYYETNLEIVREVKDRAAQGRACGNLGNTHYLLGNFDLAIKYHEERLSIAKEFGDKPAERRAYSNLGNSHVFLGDFGAAAEYYKKTLDVARQLRDVAMEAQACYSLGNTFTLMREYEAAVDYHLRHLKIAQQLQDRVGEGRACWSLGNAHTALGNHEKALQYATSHFQISREVGDRTGEVTAQMNLVDLKTVLGLSKRGQEEERHGKDARTRRKSMENLEFMSITPDKQNGSTLQPIAAKPKQINKGKKKTTSKEKLARKGSDTSSGSGSSGNSTNSTKADPNGVKISETEESELFKDDNFFDALSRFQGKRINEQRFSFGEDDDEANKEDLLDEIAKLQSSRLNEQRASVELLPGLRGHREVVDKLLASGDGAVPDDDFFEMLMRCQGTRMEDQRSSFPSERPAPTVPDEDFFGLIQRIQSRRIEEQRTDAPWERPTKTRES
ncbi:uncharacterized protein [Apostichopus japonicus]|uniref:uncharacterized protein n=1 Tax=Stichopus japonicus TaxID=307972 RepID=UPI003AB8F6D8